jgi:diguanylate cyclase (GGDEF)-like protein/PAS domain S-box-containing protein
MKQHVNHTIGILLVIPLLIFFFYKSISISSSNPFDDTSAVTSEIKSLQVKLHREILRHRTNRTHQYDTLNESVRQVSSLNESLLPGTGSYANENSELEKELEILKNSIVQQAVLIEKFKTSNSIMQNSLHEYTRLNTEIQAGSNVNNNNAVSAALLGKLSNLLLEYNQKPGHETALKIYPVLDKLDIHPDPELNTLVNHGRIIIEKRPLIDDIIESLGSLDIEQKIKKVEQLLAKNQARLDQYALIYNSLLFFASLYLLGYLAYMFLILKQNKNTLEISNEKLNREIVERTKTEKTLYRLVKETSSFNDKDFVRNILLALHKALGYRYAYVSLAPQSNNHEATISGLVDNGNFQANINYNFKGTPCEEVLHHGRLVHNRDFKNYFPDWDGSYISDAESFIGITIKDENNQVTGLLAVADDKAINNTNLAEQILSLTASRTSAELLRHAAMQDSERYHTGLESIDTWLLELISCAGDTELFYKKVCAAVREIANASMASVSLLDETGENYIYAAASGRKSSHLTGTSHALGDGSLCSWSMSNKKALHIDDVNTDIRARRQHLNRYHVKSAYVTPIYLNEAIFGAIAVFRDAMPFDHIDRQLINQFAQRVQLAVANMHLVNDIATEKERAEFTLHSIGDAVITTNTDGNIEYMNHVAERLTGCKLPAVNKQAVQNVFRILDQDTRKPVHNVIEACLTEGTSINNSMNVLISTDGSERSIESSVSPILNRTGHVEGAVIVFHDETERRRMENIIRHQATHDTLTGLMNRHQFNIELKQQIDHARTHNSKHVLCYLDLDHFKQVNDTCGQAAGDELLKQISSRLHNVIRLGDILARLGGNEFGLILQNCPVTVAGEIAEKIIHSISSYDFSWEGSKFAIGVSIGIVPVTSQTGSINEVMKHADVACYTAREQGQNRAYVYDQQGNEAGHHHEEFHWASRISDALEQDRFKLYAQSIHPLDPASNNHTHIEILVRMEDENGRLLPPASFIPAAERYQLMGAVDQHIIRQSFKFISANVHEDICFSINLSVNSLNDDRLAAFIKQCINEFEIQARLICFEIPEASAVSNLSKTTNLVEKLSTEGFKFAIDDFGGSLSSFNYLKDLPVDYLKIDGGFVRDMVNSKMDHAMVAAINQAAHVLGIRTIAEFVENDDIIEQIQLVGVDFAQGYGISRPEPLSDKTLQEMLKPTSFRNGLVSAS